MAEEPRDDDRAVPVGGGDFLIATDLSLLLLDDDEGRVALGIRGGGEVDLALAGAVLAELSLAGVADITDSDRAFRSARVTVENAGAVTDPVLQNAVAIIAEEDRSAKQLTSKLKKGLRQTLQNA